MPEAQAEAHATALAAALDDQLVTKRDLLELEIRWDAKLTERMAELEARLEARIEARIGARIDALRSEHGAILAEHGSILAEHGVEMRQLRADVLRLDRRIDAVRSDLLLRMGEMENRLTLRLGALVAFGMGALATLQVAA